MKLLNKRLRQQSRKAFFRNPMFARNLGVLLFMYFIFGIAAIELIAVGFVFDNLLLRLAPHNLAIETFNSCVLYFLLGDFVMKFLIKKSRTMQIMPYLTLPIPKKNLFDFLLKKEFSSVWNLYPLFLVLPFGLKAITPYFGFGTAVLYVLCFYLLCVCISLLVNIANSYIERSGWMMLAPIALVAAIVGIGFIPGVDLIAGSMAAGNFFLNQPLIGVVVILLVFVGLWLYNRSLMDKQLYRELNSTGENVKDRTADLSFLSRLGRIGEFMALDIKLIMRSKRLRQSVYTGLLFIIFYFAMVQMSRNDHNSSMYFMSLFYAIFAMGFPGFTMGQYIFTSESAFFDGLMAREQSLLPMLKAKYLLYASYALVMGLILAAILYFVSNVSMLFMVSAFFFAVGPVFFIMFLNAIFNKEYIDFTEGNAFSWKGTNSVTLMITLIGMLVPMTIIIIFRFIFNEEVAYYIMLFTGMLFTFTSNLWLNWIYKEFLKRKYTNMAGFRSN